MEVDYIKPQSQQKNPANLSQVEVNYSSKPQIATWKSQQERKAAANKTTANLPPKAANVVNNFDSIKKFNIHEGLAVNYRGPPKTDGTKSKEEKKPTVPLSTPPNQSVASSSTPPKEAIEEEKNPIDCSPLAAKNMTNDYKPGGYGNIKEFNINEEVPVTVRASKKNDSNGGEVRGGPGDVIKK